MDEIILNGEQTIDSFLGLLASNAPVPGGGGASSLVAAVGAALASMTCNLTVGKKKYADVEEEIKALRDEADALRSRFVALIQRDADGFKPLADAFRLPNATDEEKAYRDEVLEREYVNACKVPFEIVECCCRGIDLCIVVADKGSKMVLSDVASGLILLEAAMRSASLNIYINTRSMKDREKAEALKAKADELISAYSLTADEAYHNILDRLKD